MVQKLAKICPYQFLSQKDKKLSKLISQHGKLQLQSESTVFFGLLKAVVNQQLSQKVASTILNRIINQVGTGVNQSRNIIKLEEQGLRKCGISAAKAKTIMQLAYADTNNEFRKENLSNMQDGDLMNFLTSFWGVGPWTAEMVMMFVFGRKDIMPVADAGIIKGFNTLYNNNNISIKSKQWKPFRSYAALYLWKAIDGID